MRKSFYSLLASFILTTISLSPLKAVPENEVVRFKSGIEAFKRSSFTESDRIFSQLTSEFPEKAIYWFNLGNARFRLEDYEGATSAYEKVVALKSRLAPASQLYMAKALRKQKQWSEALRSLSNLQTEELPPELRRNKEEEYADLSRAIFEDGIRSYQSQNDTEALRRFELAEEALKQSPEDQTLASEIKMMKALSLSRLGEKEKADLEFDRVINSRSGGALKLEAQRLKQNLKPEAPYWLSADFQAGYNSNLYGNGSSDSPVGKPISNLSIGAGAQILKWGYFSIWPSANLFWNEVYGISAARQSISDIWLEFTYETRRFWLQLSPGYQYQTLGSSSLLSSPAIYTSAGYKGGSYETGLSYFFFKNYAPSTTYDFLEGDRHLLKAHVSIFGRRQVLTPALYLQKETASPVTYTTGTLPLKNTSIIADLKWKVRLAERWQSELNAAYAFMTFSPASTPGNKKRIDHRFSMSGSIFYKLGRGFETYLSPTFILNHSTLKEGDVANKRYRQWILVGGLKWEWPR